MPPLVLAPLALVWYLFVFRVFGTLPTAYAITAGAFMGYVAYDLTHYFLHHGYAFGYHLQAMKTYHVLHHYKSPSVGFGITSKFWDRVFGTVLELEGRAGETSSNAVETKKAL